jgi:hypothetical protein
VADADWFDEIRDGDDREALYRTLYYMPKGGDLHILEHAFATKERKEQLLREYNDRIGRFERQMQRRGIAQLGPMPETRSFVCNRYGLCR